jgi:protein TonB
MSHTPSLEASKKTPLGHVSVHIEGEHPADVPFMFERVQKRAPAAAGVSALVHIAVFAVLLGLRYGGPTVPTTNAVVAQELPKGIIWIAQAGPGGGGGNAMKEPPRKAELPGRDKLTVAVEKPKAVALQPPQPKPSNLASPIAQLDISALKTAAGTEVLPGAIDGAPGGLSQGPGNGGGAGTGNGTGDGPGKGPGVGPGSDGNRGGGRVRPGAAGLEDPRPIRQVKPAYTAEAMRAKIQGMVAIECVVMPDGTVADLQIVRSLDPIFGLDREAMKAARQWRFIPGTLKGQPVPVLVRIELDFALQ